MFDSGALSLVVPAAVVLILLLASIYSIGPTQVGLVRKRFGAKLPATIRWHSAARPDTRRKC